MFVFPFWTPSVLLRRKGFIHYVFAVDYTIELRGVYVRVKYIEIQKWSISYQKIRHEQRHVFVIIFTLEVFCLPFVRKLDDQKMHLKSFLGPLAKPAPRFAGNELAAPYIRQQKKCGNLDLSMKMMKDADFPISWVVSNQSEKYVWMFPKIVGFPPKSSSLMGFSLINHPFFGYPYKSNLIIYLPRQEWNFSKYFETSSAKNKFFVLAQHLMCYYKFQGFICPLWISEGNLFSKNFIWKMREATFSSWGLMTAWGGVVWYDRDHRITRCTSKSSPLSDVTQQPAQSPKG